MPPSEKIRRWVPWVLLVLGFLGFTDAAYLTAKHYQGEPPTCVFFSGCDVVTTSEYAVIGFVPVALLGALFYLSIFLLALGYLDRRNPKLLQFVFYLSIPALAFTAWLIYLQLFVIGSICIYCMFSALSSTSVFVSSLPRVRSMRPAEQSPVV